MVESTCFQHTSSHPDKYNNSVDRIISKEEEREDPRRELQSIFEYSGVSTFLQELQDFFEYSVFYKNYSVSHAIQQVSSHPVQIITRHLPVTAPRASKHSTRENPAIRPLQHKQASSNSSRQKQHSTRQGASTHSLQQFPGQFYRILPGEIGFFPKGSSIVYLCNTKVSVFQVTC